MERDDNHRARLLEDTMERVLDRRAKDGGQDITIGGPFGLWIRSRSGWVMVALLFIAACGGLAALIVHHDDNQKQSLSAMTLAQAQVERAINENREMQKALVYVMWACSQSKSECDKLNLTRPAGLREMQR